MSVPAVLSSLHPEAGPCTVPALAPPPQIHSSASPEAIQERLLERSNERFLIVSPYVSSSHLLDLDTVSTPNQLLAKALTLLETTRNDYATAPYEDAFNWSEVLNELRILCEAEHGFHWQDKTFYIVAFRSKVRPATDRSYLGALDEASHLEATQSGGLLKYWFGEPDAEGRNLATCVWRDTGDAKRGSGGAGHNRAAMMTRKMYEEWKVERIGLRVHEAVGGWELAEWVD